MDTTSVYLETKGLTKRFGDIQALDDISLQISKGEIQGLIGENGSGKSTISSIIYGIHSPTSGEMVLKGKPYNPKSPLDAREHHISMIVQEKDTIDMLSIAENIFLGNEDKFRRGTFINIRKMNQEAAKALDKVGLKGIDVTQPVVKLGFETRKLVEIARALYYEPELMIVDETTTALSHDGRMKIYEIMRQFKNEGKAVLFISHDLPELMEVCDSLTVLRDGKLITVIDKEEFSETTIKKKMVGRTLAENLYRTDYEEKLTDRVAISADNISTELLKNITFSVHDGEIVGIGGLSGSGMHEIGRILAGINAAKKGSVRIYGEELRGIAHALKLKVGYISKDRDVETLILNESIQDNLTISAWDIIKKSGVFILPGDEKKFANVQIENLKIKCSSGAQLVRELSGGNKQKVSFSKLIGNKSRVMILDSPTRGVDIGVKTTMYELINDLKHQGHAIIIISEELPELIGMCDRILVLKNGELTGEVTRHKDLKDVDLIDYMI
jgi:ribose transport system ATP-binding protein